PLGCKARRRRRRAGSRGRGGGLTPGSTGPVQKRREGNRSMIERVISGGQTGADQGGLQAAMLFGIPTDGGAPAIARVSTDARRQARSARGPTGCIRAILTRVSVRSPFEGAEPVLDPLDHFRQAGGNRSVSCSLMGRSCVERSLR